jgi:hypothetical protein
MYNISDSFCWDVRIYRIYSDKRRPPFTTFNFQENTNIHISQVFMSLIVCIFNILELNNHDLKYLCDK